MSQVTMIVFYTENTPDPWFHDGARQFPVSIHDLLTEHRVITH